MNEVWHARSALSRVVESGSGGQDLAAGTWQRLEALPDPRSSQGRIYPLACLVAIAICAFTAAGNATGSPRPASGSGGLASLLARLRAPWDPIVGRYRAPDEKTIRVVLDRLDPRALARPCSGQARAPTAAPAGHPRPACTATVGDGLGVAGVRTNDLGEVGECFFELSGQPVSVTAFPQCDFRAGVGWRRARS